MYTTVNVRITLRVVGVKRIKYNGRLLARCSVIQIDKWMPVNLGRKDWKIMKIGRDTSELQSLVNLVCRLLLEKIKEFTTVIDIK